MTCCVCNRNMVDCICPDADDRLAELLSCPQLDSNWIAKIQAQRLLNRFDIERERTKDETSTH